MSKHDDLKRDFAKTNSPVLGRSVSPRSSNRSHVSSAGCEDLRESGRADGSSRGATPTGSAEGGSHSGQDLFRGRSLDDNSAKVNPSARDPAAGGPGEPGEGDETSNGEVGPGVGEARQGDGIAERKGDT